MARQKADSRVSAPLRFARAAQPSRRIFVRRGGIELDHPPHCVFAIPKLSVQLGVATDIHLIHNPDFRSVQSR